jgi:hypothetical protein
MVLKNRNVLDKKINKKVVQKMIDQAQKYDIDTSEPDGNVTVSYTSLMKSLTYISLIFKQILTFAGTYNEQLQNEVDQEMETLGLSGSDEEEDEDDDDDDDDDNFGLRPSRLGLSSIKKRASSSSSGSTYSGATLTPNAYDRSQWSFKTPFQQSPKEHSRLGSYGRNLPTPQEIRSMSGRSSRANTTFNNSAFQNRRVLPYQVPRYGDDGGDDNLSELSMRTRRTPVTKKIVDNINANALEKETVNVKFIAQSLEGTFSTLTKNQKHKLKTLCETILKQMREIIEYYPESTKIYDQLINVFEMLRESIKTIEDQLRQSGEGNFVGAGINPRLLRMHQPQQYINFNNVNANWRQNLARRNI